MKFTLKKIAEVCGGRVIGDENKEVTGFFTDSRQAKEGLMFVPIKGENVDGHKFISIVASVNACSFTEVEIDGVNAVLVENNRNALQKLALYYRKSFDIPFIGITGSVGKTTSKDMLALTLESVLSVHKTAGNANSQVGLPLTLFNTEAHNDVAVIEMGISLPGEMERLAKTAQPDLAIITNIGISHIEFLGSREGILEQKLHIADYLGQEKPLFVNGDDDLLSTLKETTNYNVITFGTAENCDFRAVDINEYENGSEFTCLCKAGSFTASVPAPGIHNVRNALMCIAVAQYLKIDINKTIDALKEYQPAKMRQEIKKINGFTVIDDSYNASPDSAYASLDVIKSSTAKRKIAVLADMLELGDYSEKAHFSVGEYAKKCKVDMLLCVGEEAKHIARGFGEGNSTHIFENSPQAAKFLLHKIQDGDLILIKGSRGMKTDIIVAEIEKLSENKKK